MEQNNSIYEMKKDDDVPEDNNENEQEEEEDEDEGFVVRCRGLPWSTTLQELESFFSQCQLKNGNKTNR